MILLFRAAVPTFNCTGKCGQPGKGEKKGMPLSSVGHQLA